MDARRYANLSGKTVRGTVKIWDSNQAGVTMLWAKRQGRERFAHFLDELYARFWRRELDIDSVEVLESLVRDTGLEVSGYREYLAGPGRRALGRRRSRGYRAAQDH